MTYPGGTSRAEAACTGVVAGRPQCPLADLYGSDGFTQELIRSPERLQARRGSGEGASPDQVVCDPESFAMRSS